MIPVILAASAIIGAAGTIYGGITANRTARANAAALEQQAALRREQARVAMENADIRQRRAAGSRDAMIAKTGIDAASFSDVIADDIITGVTEKRMIQYGADVDSANLRNQANMQRSQGQNAMIGSFFSAAGSALSTYGKANTIAAQGVTVQSPWTAAVTYGG